MTNQLIADIKAAYAAHPEFVPTRLQFAASNERSGICCCALGACYLNDNLTKRDEFYLLSKYRIFSYITEKYGVTHSYLDGVMHGFDHGKTYSSAEAESVKTNFGDSHYQGFLVGKQLAEEIFK